MKIKLSWQLLVMAAAGGVGLLVVLWPKLFGNIFSAVGEGVATAATEGYWGLGMGLTGAAAAEREFQAAEQQWLAAAPARSAARQQKQVDMIRADPVHEALEWNKALTGGNVSLANDYEDDFRAAGLNPREVLRGAGYVVQ